jgi:hypothetical protein
MPYRLRENPLRREYQTTGRLRSPQKVATVRPHFPALPGDRREELTTPLLFCCEFRLGVALTAAPALASDGSIATQDVAGDLGKKFEPDLAPGLDKRQNLQSDVQLGTLSSATKFDNLDSL